MKIVTTQEMRDIEAAADATGLSYAQMMQNAGQAVALAIRDHLRGDRGDHPERVLVLVGPGNNGGDGLVAARHLHTWGHSVRLILWRRDPTDDPLLAAVRDLGLPIETFAEGDDPEPLRQAVRESDVIIDALLGTGVTGELRGGVQELLAAVDEELERLRHAMQRPGLVSVGDTSPARAVARGPLIVALDVPTGLDSDTGAVDEHTLGADLCVTLAYPKRGHFAFPGAAHVGQLIVADIGIDPAQAQDVAINLATSEQVGALLPVRRPDANKGSFGKVLVVAGSVNFMGAPLLATTGAYRVGAGLVTLAVPAAIQNAVAAHQTEATYLLLPHDMGVLAPQAVRVLADSVGQYDVLLLGPGLGQETPTKEFVEGLLQGVGPKPRQPIGLIPHQAAAQARLEMPSMVIDADGLNLLAKMDGWWRALPSDSVVTPHPGEMARLLDSDIQQVNADRIETAQQAAKEWGCTVVLKGAFTVIATPQGGTTLIPFATPALATAGTGDVLAGAIAGFIAQGLSGEQAAVCGAYVHGLAGMLWQREHGTAGLLAEGLGMYLVRAQRTLRP